MSLTPVSLAATFLYFRIIVAAGLNSPLVWAGLVAFAAHRSWSGAGLFVAAAVTSYATRNGLLFREAARRKREVIRFIERYPGAVYERFAPQELARYFDFSFLIPSYIRPGWLIQHVAGHRLHVFMVRRGTSSRIFASPCAFVSAVAQDCYIFMRGPLSGMDAVGQFKLTHELGHGAAIYTANAQRNLVGLTPIWFSIAWTISGAPWTIWFCVWTVLEILAVAVIGGAMMQFYRGRQRFNSEIVGDYMAARHLPDAVISELVQLGGAAAVLLPDPSLSERENRQRYQLLDDALNQLDRGEAIEIPMVYLRETFRHPLIFSALLCAHIAYLAYFAAASPPGLLMACIFMVPCIIGIFWFILLDSVLGLRIGSLTSPAGREL